MSSTGMEVPPGMPLPLPLLGGGCAGCVVSNRMYILGGGIFVALLSAVLCGLVWFPTIANFSIIAFVLEFVLFVLALAMVAVPLRCAPCRCGVAGIP